MSKPSENANGFWAIDIIYYIHYEIYLNGHLIEHIAFYLLSRGFKCNYIVHDIEAILTDRPRDMMGPFLVQCLHSVLIIIVCSDKYIYPSYPS